jgi:Ca2+-binding RTX toxin-like protein
MTRPHLQTFAVFSISVLLLGGVSPSAAAPSTVQCKTAIAHIVGTAGNDELEGTPGPDVIAGLGGQDVIEGHGGRDVICGGAMGDTIRGGRGHDFIFGSAGNDRVHGGIGNDWLKAGAGSNREWGGRGLDRIFVPRSGNDHHDVFYGGRGRDRLAVTNADDVHGGRGGDLLWVRAYRPGTDQVVDGGLGPNEVYFNRFRRNAGVKWNQVTIDLAHHRIEADGATSTLKGRFQRFHLDGSFAAHRWTIIGTGADDFLDPRATQDSVTLHGRAGEDVLFGTNGDDVLVGGSGADVLHGRWGDDILRGGLDADQGDGGPGTDMCVSIEAPTPAHSTTRCEL